MCSGAVLGPFRCVFFEPVVKARLGPEGQVHSGFRCLELDTDHPVGFPQHGVGGRIRRDVREEQSSHYSCRRSSNAGTRGSPFRSSEKPSPPEPTLFPLAVRSLALWSNRVPFSSNPCWLYLELSGEDDEIDRRRPKDALSKLRDELDEAVRKEQYEKAAKLRDRIREMESREGGTTHTP